MEWIKFFSSLQGKRVLLRDTNEIIERDFVFKDIGHSQEQINQLLIKNDHRKYLVVDNPDWKKNKKSPFKAFDYA
jgi:hypothetical protein